MVLNRRTPVTNFERIIDDDVSAKKHNHHTDQLTPNPTPITVIVRQLTWMTTTFPFSAFLFPFSCLPNSRPKSEFQLGSKYQPQAILWCLLCPCQKRCWFGRLGYLPKMDASAGNDANEAKRVNPKSQKTPRQVYISLAVLSPAAERAACNWRV